MAERKQRLLGVQRAAADVIPESNPGENTKYSIGDDIGILLDEVLNNKTRAILIFDDFSGRFTDFEMYQLSVVIKYNTSLVAVTVSGVDIGDESVAMLCQALIPTNVQYIDFTNTPLDEEAGSSLAALARCNTNLRTVIVTDTLINEDMMDEIDVACMDNEIGNDAARVAPIDPDRTMYCYAHVLQSCPNGEYCLFSHAPPGSQGISGKELLNWEKALPPPPKEGASWRVQEPDDGDDNHAGGDGEGPAPRLRVDLMQFRNARRQAAAAAGGVVGPPQLVDDAERQAPRDTRRWYGLGLGALAVVAVAAGVALLASRRIVRSTTQR